MAVTGAWNELGAHSHLDARSAILDKLDGLNARVWEERKSPTPRTCLRKLAYAP
ncbi:hypothetical protein BT69DRAFT_1282582, partial [Atractiella rhizophila]